VEGSSFKKVEEATTRAIGYTAFYSPLNKQLLGPRRSYCPSGIDRSDLLALFRLFFTNEMLDKMAGWTNTYVKANLMLKEEAPECRVRLWFPTCRQELYAYFGAVIHMGIMIEPAVEDYWGLIEKGAAYKVTKYILKTRFEQFERYI